MFRSLLEKNNNATQLVSLGQAGFILKSQNGQTLGIDLYLSDCVERFEALSTKTITPSQQSKLLSILEAFAVIPVLVKEEKDSAQSSISIVNTQNQSQSQSTDVCVLVFREAIKDEITGKDYKEVSSILNDSSLDGKKKKDRIVEKIKSLGEGVLSNIVANIITNPAVMSAFI